MVRVVFTRNLQRHVAVPPQEVHGETVREILDAAFDAVPRLRGYVVDEQGALRRHMCVFVDGLQVRDRKHLSDTVPDGSEVHVMQALSGG